MHTHVPLLTRARRFGEVTEVRIITDRDSGLCKGFAFVGFASRDQAQAAKYGMDGYRLEGKNLIVRTAGAKDERAPRREGPGMGGPPPRDREGAIRGPGGVLGHGHGPPGMPPLPPGVPLPGYGPPPPGYGPPPPGYGPPPPGYGRPPGHPLGPPPGHWGWDPYGACHALGLGGRGSPVAALV